MIGEVDILRYSWVVGAFAETSTIEARFFVMRIRTLLLSSVIALAFVTSPADGAVIGFDGLPNLTTVTDQFAALGIGFDGLQVIEEGTLGVDGSASPLNSAAPTNVGISIFDGKSSNDITTEFGIPPQVYSDGFVDILFFVPGTSVPAVTDSVSLLAGFDHLDLMPNEDNRMVLEAFDISFNQIAFDISSTLNSATPSLLAVAAPGIRGVRITHSDGVTFDEFTFNTPVPEPSSGLLWIACMGMFVLRRCTTHITRR